MWGYTTVVGALALGLIAVAAMLGGLLFFALPVALVGVGVAAGFDFYRRRREVQRMKEHADRAKPAEAAFTERDRQTLISD
jgi:hypothetical protein